MEKLVYSIKETAWMLGIAESAVRALCHREDFPAIRVSPRRIVIPAQGLQEWLNKGKSVSL